MIFIESNDFKYNDLNVKYKFVLSIYLFDGLYKSIGSDDVFLKWDKTDSAIYFITYFFFF